MILCPQFLHKQEQTGNNHRNIFRQMQSQRSLLPHIFESLNDVTVPHGSTKGCFKVPRSADIDGPVSDQCFSTSSLDLLVRLKKIYNKTVRICKYIFRSMNNTYCIDFAKANL